MLEQSSALKNNIEKKKKKVNESVFIVFHNHLGSVCEAVISHCPCIVPGKENVVKADEMRKTFHFC